MSLSGLNTRLRDDLATNEDPFEDATRLRQEVLAVLDAAEARQADWSKDQNIMLYQADEMDMIKIWSNVRHQRSRVALVRQSVFEPPPGARPKPGTANRRFYRLQATLDPEEQRLVDYMCRTESEAEEEAGIPEQLGGPWVPPFEELKAYAEATREEKPQGRWWWRWPFNRHTDNERGSDNVTLLADER